MSRLHWIVNTRTKEYIHTESETFDGDWKENYPHTAGESWLDVYAASLFEYDMVNGIYYTYDLCCDGELFTLWCDRDQHTPEDIAKAKAELRRKQDVVSLSVRRLRKVEAAVAMEGGQA